MKRLTSTISVMMAILALLTAGCGTKTEVDGIQSQGFVQTVIQVRQVHSLVLKDKLEQARNVYYSGVDPFLHQLDPVLSQKDRQFAGEVRRTMLRIEIALSSKNPDLDGLKSDTSDLPGLLKTAAGKLGLHPNWK